ncbi:MAG TPA: DUF2252 domain-containing protein [Streptosporangiaceae bacterium]
MTTTQKQARTARVSRKSSPRASTAKIPAPRKRSTAKPESRASEPTHRYHLDTLIKDLTPTERAERGRQIRAEVPRSSHAEFDASVRQHDPVDVLIGQCTDRVPDLIPIRYGRMLASPFAYFRGAALPMANDLATTPVTGLAVQACGDAHVGNFGLFGSAERRLVFDINDFDETLPGPWEWDVKRLAASLEVAARDNGIKTGTRRAMVQRAVRRYRLAMAEFAGQANLSVWYASADVDAVRQRLAQRLGAQQQQRLARGVTKARTKDSMNALDKLTRIVDGEPQIVPDPPLVVPLSSLIPNDMDPSGLENQLVQLVDKYRRTLSGDRRYLLDQFQYRTGDIARKVVGVGSVGTRCWIMLMLGKDPADPLFLQIKEAGPAVLSEFAGPSKYDNQGQRVVEGQRLMQAASDIFLGWLRASPAPDGVDRDFYVRQLRDWKFSFDTQTMLPAGLSDYGEVCGWTLARAHARSGDRIGISAYLGKSDTFDRAIAEFASAYADTNELDLAALDEAAKSGRVLAERGV